MHLLYATGLINSLELIKTYYTTLQLQLFHVGRSMLYFEYGRGWEGWTLKPKRRFLLREVCLPNFTNPPQYNFYCITLSSRILHNQKIFLAESNRIELSPFHQQWDGFQVHFRTMQPTLFKIYQFWVSDSNWRGIVSDDLQNRYIQPLCQPRTHKSQLEHLPGDRTRYCDLEGRHVSVNTTDAIIS